MKTTEVNKELIGRRCECIFTGLMVTGVIEDTEENEHTIEVKVRFDHRHIVAFEVVEVTRRQHGKGGFADPALLGGKGDIKGRFLVFHIASVHYWLIDLFIASNHSFHIAILKY